MLHDPLRWVLYSPRRLLALALCALVLAVAGVTWAAEDDASAPEQTAAPSQAADPSPSPSPHADRAERAESQASVESVRSTARDFLTAYVVAPEDGNPHGAPTSLRELTTPSLWRGLRLTDADRLPRGAVEQLVVDEAGSYSGLVTAELDTGLSLNVSLVAWDRGWRVSGVRPGNGT